MGVAGCERPISRREDRDFFEGHAEDRQRIIESTVEEMRHADAGQMEAPLAARVEAHRSLEMLDRQIGISSKQAKPTAPIPGMSEARVERESSIDQREGGINVLAEAPEHDRDPADHIGVVGGEADGLPGKRDGRPAIFLFIAIVGPVEVLKIGAVASGLSKSKAIARLAGNRLSKQVERSRDMFLLVAGRDRAGAQVKVVGGEIAGRPLDREADLGGSQRGLDDPGDAGRNLVLKIEDVVEGAVEPVRP